MNEKVYRTTIQVILAISIIVPLGIMLFINFNVGLMLLLSGLVFGAWAVVSGRWMRRLDAEGENDTRHAAERQNRGSTIYVPLLDDAGNPLDPAAAERLLARARMMAGPRETVVGVERTPADARKL